LEKPLELLKKEQTGRKSRRTDRQSAALEEYAALEAFDRKYLETGSEVLAGVDEAGRGALAGPVVSVAVILPHGSDLLGVRDSKLVRESDREALFSQIVERALSVGIAIGHNDFIDKNNILVATLSTMARAVKNLKITPDIVIVDGRDTFEYSGDILAVTGADRKSLSVAAASIIAKVTRDRLMRKMHRRYPLYNFKKNKGYGTKEHVEAIFRYGRQPVHRKSYKLKSIEKNPRMI
jgi:ribonuclease HII